MSLNSIWERRAWIRRKWPTHSSHAFFTTFGPQDVSGRLCDETPWEWQESVLQFIQGISMRNRNAVRCTVCLARYNEWRTYIDNVIKGAK